MVLQAILKKEFCTPALAPSTIQRFRGEPKVQFIIGQSTLQFDLATRILSKIHH